MPSIVARLIAGFVVALLLTITSNAQPEDDTSKQIAEVERQILELQKKLEVLKRPSITSVSPGMIPDDYIKQFTWRSIGPANMGGRITSMSVVEADPTTYYVATASGGLLKTTNNGTTFAHLFDRETTVSIGDVAVAPSDPNIVWVGTGEANPRNSVSSGDGVYKSIDAGKTWTNMGLKKSFQIGRVVIHPKDPNIVYVGALGRLYGPSEERGLFKTTDGGKTWTKILYIDDKTGVIDFRLDPFDPEGLIVATWERKRDEFDSFFGEASKWPTQDQYGPAVTHSTGSGLHKSTDGGKSWKKLNDDKLKNGLPTVKLGRIGLDYSRVTKGLIYAIIDTEKVGMGRPTLTVYIGVSTEDDKGMLKVTAVTDDGPGGKAGIKEGDYIDSIDGVKIDNYDSFLALLAMKKPGDIIKLIAKRGDKELPFAITLAPRPATDTPAAKTTAMLMPSFTPKITPEGVVTVGSLPAEGAAEKAGVKVGMIVKSADGRDVRGWRDFVLGLRASPRSEDPRKAGDKVRITFKENDITLDVELPLAMTDVVAPPTGRGQPSNRPFASDPSGQRPNAEAQQGKEGYQTGGVFASADEGHTWTRVNSLNPRPFYFSQVRADPVDANTVYVLGDVAPGNSAGLWRSTDGGKKFLPTPAKGLHPDLHALWIDPRDTRHLIVGCDGGFYTTYDRGLNWEHIDTPAIAQFYHVAVDNRKPYRVYGGLQDNGSWGGASHTLRPSGPINDDWFSVAGGDGFVCRVDPADADIVYTESQDGQGMGWRNMRTGERGFIRPQVAAGGEPLRFNWNTPYIVSQANPGIIYSAANFVFRSVRRGAAAKAISPEISRTKQGSGTAVAESPKNPDVLWAGTDDGYIWVTRDGGTTWTNVFEKLVAAGLPGPRWVSSIDPSRTVEGRCYVVLDGHRSDDDKPYAFVTEDFGKSWKPIVAGLPIGSTRVLREDLINPDLLYLGTEFGAWASIDRGSTWTKLTGGLPTVAVHEFAQPTTASEVVAATHGRGIWILDVASLRQIKPETLKAPATLLTPSPAVRWKIDGGRENSFSPNTRKFIGQNPDRRARIDYILAAPAKELSLKIQDVAGKTVQEFRAASKTAGYHRETWSLTRGNAGAALVPAGGYRVVLIVDGKEYVQPLTVENDPHADPKAVITVNDGMLDVEGDDEREEQEEIRPFILKAED